MPKIKLSLPVVLVLVLAISLRFYNLFGNFAIDGDSGRDVMVAHEAIRRGEIPLTGPFTSAGPFVFGPAFWWFVIVSYLLLPFGLYSPWVAMFFVAIIFVVIIMAIAFQIGGKKLALIAGLLAASSPQMVMRSKALTQHTLIAITASLAMLFFILLWKKKKGVYAFLLGLSIAFAVSLHYQALNLLPLLLVFLVIPKTAVKTKIFYLLLIAIGFLLPSLPLLFWDSRQNFANLNNLLDYFLIGQYRQYVPMSWKLFLFRQFPDYFNWVVGGLFPVGLILFWSTIIWGILIIRKKIRSLDPLVVLTGFYFFLLFVNRYYHGERFEGYLIYFVPFLLLFSAVILEKLGPLVLIIVLGLNIWSATRLLETNKYNYKVMQAEAREIQKFFGSQPISLHQINDNSSLVAYPLYLALTQNKALKQTEPVPLGVLLDTSKKGYSLVDLRAATVARDPKLWKQLSDRAAYDDLVGWLQKNQLKSPFILSQYIKERLPK